MVRLVFMDVDGTLVGSHGQIHERVWESVQRARARGIRLAISTGRPGFGITRAFASRLDADGWHVFQNGASIVHAGTGETLSRALPEGSAPALLDRARATGRLIEFYTDTDYAFEGPAPRARAHAELLGLPFHARPVSELSGPLVRAQWLVAPEEAEAVSREPHPGLEISHSSSPFMPDTQFLNLTASGVSKASALRTVADAYGLSLDQVMFIGDSGNDLEAMRQVGWPVAMANSEPAVLAAARLAVGHVDQGGAADALDRVISELRV